MTDPTVRATLPQAADLLLRWFKYELNDRTIQVDTMKFLQACGKLKPLSSEAVSTLGIRDEGET